MICAVLAVNLIVHYGAYIPALQGALGDSTYLALQSVLEMNALIIVIYAGTVFRLRGSAASLAVLAIALIPVAADPTIVSQDIGAEGASLLAGLVAFILFVGAGLIVIQEIIARERERRANLAVAVTEVNLRLDEKKSEPEATEKQLQSTRTQLTALNRLAQKELQRLLDELEESTAT